MPTNSGHILPLGRCIDLTALLLLSLVYIHNSADAEEMQEGELNCSPELLVSNPLCFSHPDEPLSLVLSV